MLKAIITILALAATLAGQAQKGMLDTTLFDPHVTLSYAYQIPGGDLASRFGNNNNIGFGFHIKSRNQWYYGLQGTFIFGNRVIAEKGFLQNLLVEEKYILDNDGFPAKFDFQERGFTVTAEFGRLFPVIGPNVNSGILVKMGTGLLQHKIRIEHQESRINQLDGDYGKGYDRLTNGLVVNQFIGYYHMSNNRLINFTIGLEAWQGFTQSRREFNFDTMEKDTQKRNDNLVGIRAGWTLHLYKRMSDHYYYY
jgi:hypothetical protein